MTERALETVRHYHEETKHFPNRYARSLGGMDWATQPDPFRRFAGARTIPLSLADSSAAPAYDELFEPCKITPRPVTGESISFFFQYALAISAWKEFQGSRWALRINPSSGNLHPTEGYLVTGPIEQLTETGGVFHYAPKNHSLEQRRPLSATEWHALCDGFAELTFFVGLTSIHWREAWKYGERAYRYCQHDVGHALAAVSLSAGALGWRGHPLPQLGDRQLASLLGLDRTDDFEDAEEEHPDLLVAVVPATAPIDGLPLGLPASAIEAVKAGPWLGHANTLSPGHTDWPIIEEATHACLKPAGFDRPLDQPDTEFDQSVAPRRMPVSAERIISQRRSAMAMDGKTSISRNQFYLMMDRVLPRFDRAPWCALGPPVFVHLGLFVHLVEGLTPGLYVLVRQQDRVAELRACMHAEYGWSKPEGCPEHLPLYHLMSGDARRVAGEISCGQQIAAGGAFSLGMFASFEGALRHYGPWIYRRLFWETGVIGQVLYLEAEAVGLRATGIGCFFDDAMHELLGFADRKYQSLYHFTVGGPVEDERLVTLEAYGGGEGRTDKGT